MKQAYRSFVIVLIGIVAIFLTSCGGPSVPETYTAEQLRTIERAADGLSVSRSRMGELEELILKKDWTFVSNLIHGPFGELRGRSLRIVRNLLPSEQKNAKQVADKLFDDLVDIDAAAEEQNISSALANYKAAVVDFDAFLDLIPQTAPEISEEPA